ncbi:hypothetical protein SEVIR_3G281450v4 [Setaria viridis]
MPRSVPHHNKKWPLAAAATRRVENTSGRLFSNRVRRRVATWGPSPAVSFDGEPTTTCTVVGGAAVPLRRVGPSLIDGVPLQHEHSAGRLCAAEGGARRRSPSRPPVNRRSGPPACRPSTVDMPTGAQFHALHGAYVRAGMPRGQDLRRQLQHHLPVFCFAH